jgi:thiamine-phosphate pyrophosphorylase
LSRSFKTAASGKPDKAVYRILDANANRLREGLRTVEEYFRFVRQDRRLFAELKAIRHSLQKGLEELDASAMIAARKVQTDVGRGPASSEMARKSLYSTAVVNLKRCQESSRVMEEYSKLVRVGAAKQFKKIRFRLYDFEKKFILNR